MSEFDNHAEFLVPNIGSFLISDKNVTSRIYLLDFFKSGDLITVHEPPIWVSFEHVGSGILGVNQNIHRDSTPFCFGFFEFSSLTINRGIGVALYPQFKDDRTGVFEIVISQRGGGLRTICNTMNWVEQGVTFSGRQIVVGIGDVQDCQRYLEWKNQKATPEIEGTIKCIECGFINEYMDPKPGYVCSGCKMLRDAWA